MIELLTMHLPEIGSNITLENPRTCTFKSNEKENGLNSVLVSIKCLQDDNALVRQRITRLEQRIGIIYSNEKGT